jgi:acyl-CoA hydrolase
MNEFYSKYQKKLRTPEEAVKYVKSGDWVDYTANVCFPHLLDEALAKRKDELFDVKVRGSLSFGPIRIVEADPTGEHFCYNSWHFSAYERKLVDRGVCSFIPMLFSRNGLYYKHFLEVNVAMMAVTPMDKHGYFNLSCATGVGKAILDKADIVILEINEKLPRLCGGFDQVIHIDEVDCVVEGPHDNLPQFPISPATPEEEAIAGFMMEHIRDGCALQLGIGSLPKGRGFLRTSHRLSEKRRSRLGYRCTSWLCIAHL